MGVWRTRDETYHGSKWGYMVVAVVLLIVMSLLGSIFYLIGEGIRSLHVDSDSVLIYLGIIIIAVFILIILALICIKAGWLAYATFLAFFTHFYNFFLAIWNVIWALFKNVYVLVVGAVLAILLIATVALAVTSNLQISLANPLVIAVLIFLLVMFFPFAIFIIDLFSLEHE